MNFPNIRLFAGLCLCGLAVNTVPAAQVSHVVQISLDGLGATYLQFFVTNAPEEFPNFVRLMNEGAYTMNARCDYDISETVPNHASMFTARPVFQPDGLPDTTHHGYNNNFPGSGDTFHMSGNPNVSYKASMFDVTHDYGLSTALFTGKTRLAICQRSYNETNGAPDEIGEDNGQNKIDFASVLDIQGAAISNQVNMIVDDLNSVAPRRYRFIHIAEPDLTGHASGWRSANWSNAVRNVDRQLGRIINAIDSNPVLSNQTALLVTADHGGGGVAPNGHTESYHITNYTIPFFVRAPGIPAGADLYTLFSNRGNPGTNRTDYTTDPQPIRGGDASNLGLMMLGLPPIPGSFMVPAMGRPGIVLNMARFQGRLGVFWSDLADDHFLETADTLAPDAQWQLMTNNIEVMDTTKVFSLMDTESSPVRFFRLRKRVLAITGQPQSQTVHIGASVTFQAGVQATESATHQWRFNDAPIAGGIESSFTLPSVQPADAGEYSFVVSDAFGAVTSAVATLTVLLDPVITQQPQSQDVAGGATATFSVSATGAGDLSYQWRYAGADIPDATDSMLVINDVQPANEGTYDVVVTDGYGSATSESAELRVLVPITFVQRPQSQTVGVGDNVTFAVEIAGNPPPFLYTWRRNVTQLRRTELSSERTASYTITNVQLADAGNYIVVVSNAATSAASSLPAAMLTVTNQPALTLSQ